MAFIARTQESTTYELDYKTAKIKCRPLTNDELNSIRKRHTTKKNTKRGVEEDTNWDAVFIEKFQMMVLDWDILDENKQLWPCTNDNKAKFINYNLTDAIDMTKEIEELGSEVVIISEKN